MRKKQKIPRYPEDEKHPTNEEDNKVPEEEDKPSDDDDSASHKREY